MKNDEEELAESEASDEIFDDTPFDEPKTGDLHPVPVLSRGDLPVKRKGRPVKEENSGKPILAPRFPTPPARQFITENPIPNRRPNNAFNWFNNLPLAFRDRCDWYVYRDVPVLVNPPVDAATNRPEWYKYIDKVGGSDVTPLKEENDLLLRYGCGRYTLYLNETDKLKGVEGRNILRMVVTGLGSDYDRYPPNDPLIGDIHKVDINHPDNRSYIQFLKKTGKLPDDLDKEREKEEMANVQVVEKLMEQNERLTGTLMKNAQERPAPQPQQSTQQQQIDIGGLVGVALDAIQKSKGMDTREVLELVKEMRPPISSSSDEVRELRSMLFDTQKQRIDSLEKLVEKVTAAPLTPPASINPNPSAPTSPFQFFKDGISALKEMKHTMDDLSGGKASGDSDDAAGIPKWLTFINPSLQALSQIVANGVQAYALYQRSTDVAGAPIAATSAVPTQTPTQQPGPMPAQQPAAASSITTNMIPAPTPDIDQVTLIFNAIQVPLLNYLRDPELDGWGFADWFIGGFGVPMYEELRKHGAMIEMAMTNYPPIKPSLDALPSGRLHSFIEEFLNVDVQKILSGDDKDDEGEEEEVEAAAAPTAAS